MKSFVWFLTGVFFGSLLGFSFINRTVARAVQRETHDWKIGNVTLAPEKIGEVTHVPPQLATNEHWVKWLGTTYGKRGIHCVVDFTNSQGESSPITLELKP